jgi:enoyl-CoA hydratase/carnithine racemase
VSEVRIDLDGPVAVITLDAFARRNSLTPVMAATLIARCDEIDANPTIGAAVVQGANGAFCAGASLNLLSEVSSDPTEAERWESLGMIYRSFLRVGQLTVPTIAAIRGHAVGAGMNLALSTDLRIVARDARLTAGFSQLGVHPGGGSLTLLRERAGAEAAAAVALFGESLSGERAVQIGLAWEALDDGAVEARALYVAHQAAGDPELARAVVRSLHAESRVNLPVEMASDYERALQLWSLRRGHARRDMPEGRTE